MTKFSAALPVMIASLFLSTSALASPVTGLRPLMIADIGRDTVEMSQNHEVLPTVSDLHIEYPVPEVMTAVTATTIVAVSLDQYGKLVTTGVYKTCGNAFLDTQAVYAVEWARFKPGTIAGKPVAGDYVVRIDFGNDR